MNDNQSLIKKNITSLQVLKTLKILFEGSYTMNELILRLNSDEKYAVFNNSVISKYINTCRYCGIEIPKIDNKYTITRLPFGIDIDCSDIKIIQEIYAQATDILSGKSYLKFKSFFNSLFRYFNKDLTVYKNCNLKKTINLFEEKDEDLSENNTVIFKIKGELIKRYHLRENEYVLEENLPEYIVVVNKGEEKDVLFSRLFRYAEYCEIQHPKFYREEVREILKNALSNYGEIINE